MPAPLQFTTITVIEGNAPLETLVIMQGGQPYDLAGLTLELFIKASADAADPGSPNYTSSSGISLTGAGGTDGTCLVQFAARDTATVGRQWFRLDSLNGSSFRQTLMTGPFVVLAA